MHANFLLDDLKTRDHLGDLRVERLTASIIRAIALMKAVSTSETSVNFYETARRNIPEDSNHRSFMSLRSPFSCLLLDPLT
jgi:hypothetical protein